MSRPPTDESNGCERVLARLDRYLDHDLPPLDEARDAGHLEVCAACRAELQRRERVLATARGVLAEPSPELDSVLEEVRAALAERMERGGPSRTPLLLLERPLLVGACTAAAAVLLLVLLELIGVAPQLTRIARPEFPDLELRLPDAEILLELPRGSR